MEAKSLVPIVSGRATRTLEPPRSLSADLGRPLVAREKSFSAPYDVLSVEGLIYEVPLPSCVLLRIQ